MGEGVRRILDVMRSNALAAPVFRTDTSGFTVTLLNRSLYPDDIRLWLSNFDDFDLTEEQRAAMALGYGAREFSTQDVIDRLGIVDTAQVQEVLTPLRSLGLIERTASHGALIKRAARQRLPKRSVPSLRVADPALWQGHIAPQAQEDPPAGTSEHGPVGDDLAHSSSEPARLDSPADRTVELYLANIGFETTREAVMDFFQPTCDVVSLSVPAYRGGPRNRGYAFATVEWNGDRNELRKLLDGKPLDGRRISVRFPRSPRNRPPRLAGTHK
jgi:ATP-dependent DNA helicase RecG